MIAALGSADSALAAKAATTTIPIVFAGRRRPGQAWSCRQPRPAGRQPDWDQFFQWRVDRQSGWNSCASWCPQPLALPCSSIRPIAAIAEITVRDVEAAARAMGLQIQVLNASTSREIDAAFATIARERPDALFVGPDPFSTAGASNWSTWRRAMRSPRHIRLATYAEAGGLMSYGTDVADAYRQVGRLCRPHPQGRQARGPAGRAVDQVRAGHQRQTARMLGLDSAADAARPRRRGDRMSAPGKAGAIQPVEVRPK